MKRFQVTLKWKNSQQTVIVNCEDNVDIIKKEALREVNKRKRKKLFPNDIWEFHIKEA